jgi:hypothetical protein
VTDAPKQSLPKQDLGAAFSRRRVDAALPPRSTPAPAAAAETTPPPTTSDTAAPNTETAPTSAPTTTRRSRTSSTAPRKPARRRSGGSGGEDATEPQVIYVPAELRARISAHRKATGSTNALVVLDAIDSLVNPGAKDPYAKLREHVDASLVPQPTRSIFEREPKRAVKEPEAGGTVQLSLRLSSRNWTILEDLVEQTGAASPTHLITVALTTYLDEHGD